MVLQLRGVHVVLGVVCGILVHVRHQDGLAVGWLDVFPAATIAVAAGADLEVKTAVDLAAGVSMLKLFVAGHEGSGSTDLVLLGAED